MRNRRAHTSPNPAFPYSRGDVAREAGVTRATIVCLEQTGTLKPFIDENRQRWFSKEEVEKYKLLRSARKGKRGPFPMPPMLPSVDNAVAARALELFDRQRTPVEVAIALAMHPTAVQELFEFWCNSSLEGLEVKRRLQAKKLEIEEDEARSKSKRYRGWQDFRREQAEAFATIAKEKRKTAELTAEQARYRLLAASGRESPERDDPADDR